MKSLSASASIGAAPGFGSGYAGVVKHCRGRRRNASDHERAIAVLRLGQEICRIHLGAPHTFDLLDDVLPIEVVDMLPGAQPLQMFSLLQRPDAVILVDEVVGHGLFLPCSTPGRAPHRTRNSARAETPSASSTVMR